MSEAKTTVNLTVNGRALTAPAGMLLIEACRAAGIEVPSFCYYPNLSLQAACRMCLVEIEKMPKLQTACTVPVAEGMVVRTETEAVKAARKGQIEFILTNHPLDCPVCDAGGQCELQDMTFRYGAASSRFIEPKRHRDEQQWSPIVYFDRPRCILCYRCVRVCGEGMDVWALGIGGQRGVGSSIIPNHGDHLQCEECGMCIDICPVGALTSGAYRYKTRPWEMQHTAAVCTFCGDGCRTTLGVRNGQILRGDNRDKSGINGDFLCIKGRYAFDFTRHDERLRQPLVRREGRLQPASWAHALETAAAGLRRQRDGGAGVGVIGSTRCLNEESYLLQKLARTGLGTNHIDHHRSADFPALLALLAGRANAGLAATGDLKTAAAVLVAGGDPTEQHPLLAWNLRWAWRLSGARIYTLADREIKLERQSHRSARVAAGTLLQALQYLAQPGPEPPAAQMFRALPPDDKRWPQTPIPPAAPVAESLADFRRLVAGEADLIAVIGAELSGPALAALAEFAFARSGRTRFILAGDDSNSRGAADMGLYPDLLPGYEPLGDAAARERFARLWGGEIPAAPGMDAGQMARAFAAGKLGALYTVGANPFGRLGIERDPETGFMVAQDLFLTETARQANVVLPALCAYEKQGTLTNTCGEVQLQRRAAEFEGAKSDLEIFYELAALLGLEWGEPSPEKVLQEIRGAVRGYDVSLLQLWAGQSQLATPIAAAAGPHPEGQAGGRDRLFEAGTLGRYSAALNSVMEKYLRKTAEGRP